MLCTLLALMCCLCGVFTHAADVAVIPPLKTRITDHAEILSAGARQHLEQKVIAFEQASEGQLAVLIVNTAQPETIEQFSLRVAEAWKIGRKGSDRGALIVIAMQERKVRIEVGYGWEGALPDVEAKRIIRETITPYFKANQYAQGIDAAIDKIKLAVSSGIKAESTTVNEQGQWEQNPPPSAKKALPETPKPGEWIDLLLLIFIPTLIVLGFIVRPITLALIAGIAAALYIQTIHGALTAALMTFVFASVLRAIFGVFRRGASAVGNQRVHRSTGWSSGPWVTTSTSSTTSTSGSWTTTTHTSSGGSFSGGGGDFGGGGASGDW